MLTLNNTKLQAWAPLTILIILGFVWGTGYSIARFAMTNGVPSLGYSFWQAVGPALMIALFARSRQQPAKLSIACWKYYLICGITGIVIPNTNMYFAAPHLPAGILALVVNTVPIIAYPTALLLKVETFSWQRLTGLFCAIGGLMMILIPRTSLPSPDMTPWVLSSLITPCSFAICSIYIAKYQPRDQDPLSLSMGMLFTASLLLAPFVIISGNFYTPHLPFTLPDWIVLLEIVLSSIGYVLFFKLVRMAGPVYYSFVDTVVVMTGLFWGFVIFGETLNEWTSLAVLLILLALFMVNKHQQAMVRLAKLVETKPIG